MSISPNALRDDIKRLKLIELQLKDAIQELSQHRDCLVMELQQLQEAKPVLEKAYAVSTLKYLLIYFTHNNILNKPYNVY